MNSGRMLVIKMCRLVVSVGGIAHKIVRAWKDGAERSVTGEGLVGRTRAVVRTLAAGNGSGRRTSGLSSRGAARNGTLRDCFGLDAGVSMASVPALKGGSGSRPLIRRRGAGSGTASATQIRAPRETLGALWWEREGQRQGKVQSAEGRANSRDVDGCGPVNAIWYLVSSRRPERAAACTGSGKLVLFGARSDLPQDPHLTAAQRDNRVLGRYTIEYIASWACL
jgi:hypothetical protein